MSLSPPANAVSYYLVDESGSYSRLSTEIDLDEGQQIGAMRHFEAHNRRGYLVKATGGDMLTGTLEKVKDLNGPLSPLDEVLTKLRRRGRSHGFGHGSNTLFR